MYHLAFADESVASEYDRLGHSTSEDKRLHKILEQEFKHIQKNLRHCTFIKKSLIPKDLINKYGMDNLWKCNLINGWRLLYFIVSDGRQEIAVIVGWMSHKEYERLFKY